MCVTFLQPGRASLTPAPRDWGPKRPVVPLPPPEQHHPEGPLWEEGGVGREEACRGWALGHIWN